jgi:tripartite-type tricarboxylate transporter receptor subunit TctC
MKLSRRKFLHLAAGVAALPTAVHVAYALDYPMRPVHLIVPFPPGGPSDTVARPMAQWLWERLGQPFIIENRPGAGTNLGTEAVVRAPADGHTLLMVAPSSAINATLYDNLNFNLVRDIAPVATITRQSQVMVVNPSFPAKTVPEFITYAKANPGKINMASPGIGTGPHVAGELLKIMAGVDMLHVPYRGTAAATADLIAGQVHVMFTSPFGLMEYIQTGKLRALAVTTSKRSEALPELPVLADFVPGYESSGWFGVGAPKNTPAKVIDKLNSEINAGLADSKMMARLSDMGATPFVSSPADFGKFIATETEKWGKVIRAANIKPE